MKTGADLLKSAPVFVLAKGVFCRTPRQPIAKAISTRVLPYSDNLSFTESKSSLSI